MTPEERANKLFARYSFMSHICESDIAEEIKKAMDEAQKEVSCTCDDTYKQGYEKGFSEAIEKATKIGEIVSEKQNKKEYSCPDHPNCRHINRTEHMIDAIRALRPESGVK